LRSSASWPDHPLLEYLEARPLLSVAPAACFKRACEGTDGIGRLPPPDEPSALRPLLENLVALGLSAQAAVSGRTGTDDELERFEQVAVPVMNAQDSVSLATVWNNRGRFDRAHRCLDRVASDAETPDYNRAELFRARYAAFIGDKNAARAVARDFDTRFPCGESRKLRAQAEVNGR
jgi:hypothetical protein